MTILIINNEHCESVAQLKGYFSGDLTPGSDIYYDLLDYGRSGDIAVWLREMDEPELSSWVESVSTCLVDSEFLAALKAAMTGESAPPPPKPPFGKCFSFEGLDCDVKDNEAKVTVRLKVLMCVNETYELLVSSAWGQRA